MDHPDFVPKPGRFPIIVDLLVRMTQLTKTSTHPFYGVVLGKQSIPLGQIHLFVTFGDVSNYNTEMLNFEVVDFSGPYLVILWRPCYVKFMAIPIYAYLMIKISGPVSIIAMEAKAQRVLDHEQSNIELAMATVAATKLKELCLNALPSSFGPAMPSTTGTFKASEDTKVIQIDSDDPAKTVTSHCQIRVVTC
jgi:hypothetical protein